VISNMFGTRIVAALTTLFNALALNLALMVASLPVITAPVAVSAASAALDRWRHDGEDRVVRQFLIEFRGRWSAGTTLGAGIPMAAAVLGAVEVRHFIRDATLAGRVGLGLGCGALLITLAALGYVFQLAAGEHAVAPVDLWSLSARLAIKSLLVTGPLSVAAVAGTAVLAAADPALLLLGLPIFLLQWLKVTARPGLRRAGLTR
jgi:hypothetical protein